MAGRPDAVDLAPPFEGTARRDLNSSRGLAPARVEHIEGEIPPELSPLDAFAARGRLLAKQLEGSYENGRRVSRLPPLAIANSLAQARPTYFRSSSTGPDEGMEGRPGPPEEEGRAHDKRQLQVPEVRPVSHHPRLSNISSASASSFTESIPAIPPSMFYEAQGHRSDALEATDWCISPTTLSHNITSINPRDVPQVQNDLRQTIQHDNLGVEHRHDHGQQEDTRVEVAPQRLSIPHPAPAKLPPGNSLTIRSVPPETPDDEKAPSSEAFMTPLPRKASAGSGFSTPPRSPFYPPQPPRSPSISSERSLNGGLKNARGLMNFSRPISRAGRQSLEMPSRQDSSDSHHGVFAEDNAPTPVSMTSEEYFDASETSQGQGPPGPSPGPAPAYIYSRYALPRGRPLNQPPTLPQDNQIEKDFFRWQAPLVPDSSVKTASPSCDQRPSCPPSPPHDAILQRGRQASTDALEKTRSRSLDTATAAHNRVPEPRIDTSEPISPPRPRTQHPSRPGLTSTASQGNVKGRNPSVVDSREISADDHLTKGIECHERGSLNESTYHLRIAAKANHPTAMLLYALACRHGWGMRPNPREGVAWLRKAADLVGLEVADEESRTEGTPVDVVEMKTRRAQFALSIYELGVSHMNGWGIEQDKALALRCFEIAGGEQTASPSFFPHLYLA